jgi:hypothetical protein
MGKTMYHIKAKNEDFSGFRNRAGKTLRFEFGEATTDNKAIAEYWHNQPGYTCIEMSQGAPDKAKTAPDDAPETAAPESGKGKKKSEDAGA